MRGGVVWAFKTTPMPRQAGGALLNDSLSAFLEGFAFWCTVGPRK